MSSQNVFIYNWQIEEETDHAGFTHEIVLYGMTDEKKTVCVHVHDFEPIIYIELPIQITKSQAIRIVEYINHRLDPYTKEEQNRKNQIVKWKLERMYKLYYARVNKDNEPLKYPYIKASFHSLKTAKRVLYMFNNGQAANVPGLGKVELKVHECEANVPLQMCQRQNIPSCGWVTMNDLIAHDTPETTCELEYKCSYKNIVACTQQCLLDRSIDPTVLAFDIECNSTIQSAMPNPDEPLDVVFQIGICMSSNQAKEHEKYLLTLGECDPIPNTHVYSYQNEKQLLLGFREFINKMRPNIIIGYNIFSFDIPYVLKRAEFHGIENQFLRLGYRRSKADEVKQVSWSSKAYSKQELVYIDTHGIIMIDALPVIKRDYKFSNYKLSTVASHFLGQTKDPLNACDIFNCYLIGMRSGELGKKSLSIVGKYCVKDSAVTLDIFKHTKMWISLSEMAKTCFVPITFLFTKGEQIKAYSQIYVESKTRGYVVESNVIEVAEDFSYTGALVVEPEPGLYSNVVPFDFTSLYPTTIISHNIDYTTLVEDGDTSIPDERCHVFEWEEHQGCDHDPLKIELDQCKEKLLHYRQLKKETVNQIEKNQLDAKISSIMLQKSKINVSSSIVCQKFKYRFLKEPMGILPKMLINLLEQRKKVKQAIKDNNKNLSKVSDPVVIEQINSENAILDKRQLSYKIAANSMYGCMGVKKGYLPLPAGACCTTSRGRVSISKAQAVLKDKYKATIVYGDTDSCYVQFDGVHIKDLWNHCVHIESELLKNKVFPPPMKLAFEETIYPSFLIMSKKRYLATECDQNANLKDGSIVKKGVILTRRDNCNFTRKCYRTIVDMIFLRASFEDCVLFLEDKIHQLVNGKIKIDEFISTKSIQERSSYKTRSLHEDPTKKQKQLKDIGFHHTEANIHDIYAYYKNFHNDDIMDMKKSTKDSDLPQKVFEKLCVKFNSTNHLVILQNMAYEIHSLPAIAQLAEKMKSRGVFVQAGSRIEFVIVQSHNTNNSKLWEKVEDVDYFQRHSDVLDLDYLYYIKTLVNPIDEVIGITFKRHNVMKELYQKYTQILTKKYSDKLQIQYT